LGQLCEIDMEPSTASIRKARLFVDVTLSAWDLHGLREPAVLLTSELATNAVIHARTPFRVTVLLDGDLTVEVADGSDYLPSIEPAAVDGESGRGLLLVSRLADRWGSRREESGKTVWFAFSLNGYEPGGATSTGGPS
jgi:anti-sigma regulatory factor (Ser/Thr protein kinase)